MKETKNAPQGSVFDRIKDLNLRFLWFLVVQGCVRNAHKR
jgi:hypothetical protein